MKGKLTASSKATWFGKRRKLISSFPTANEEEKTASIYRRS
jgi:hypothetical protein